MARQSVQAIKLNSQLACMHDGLQQLHCVNLKFSVIPELGSEPFKLDRVFIIKSDIDRSLAAGWRQALDQRLLIRAPSILRWSSGSILIFTVECVWRE